MSWLPKNPRALLASGVCLLLVSWGCATIRRLHPDASHVGEARQLTQQAQLAIHHKRWEDAELYLLEALERCPQDDSARSCLADVLWNRGAREAAIEQLAKATAISGRKQPEPLTRLARMELAEGHLEAALLHTTEAIEADRAYCEAWSLRGLILQRKGDTDAALASFFRALSLKKDNPRTRLEIAQIYRARGQPQRALAILDAASRAGQPAHPLQPDIYFLRGLVLRQLDRPGDAAVALAKSRSQRQSDPELLFHLADAHLAAGNLTQARSAAEDALACSAQAQRSPVVALLQRIEVARQQAATGNSWR